MKILIMMLIVLEMVSGALAMQLTSPAFKQGETIPVKYSCDGNDITPPLKWIEVPPDIQSFVLILEDPDAPMGTWDHWLVYNIPGETRGFAEDEKNFPAQIKFGKNSWGRMDYGGPCPPDKTHRYFFRLYALDAFLSLEAGANKQQLEKTMQGHVLDKAELMGTYTRNQQTH